MKYFNHIRIISQIIYSFYFIGTKYKLFPDYLAIKPYEQTSATFFTAKKSKFEYENNTEHNKFASD